MAVRMLTKEVDFRRPFVLAGFERIEPAGRYTVDTEEESIDDVSFPVWKRIATVIHITHGGATEYVRIDPSDLAKALVRDAACEESTAANEARLINAHAPKKSRLARRKTY